MEGLRNILAALPSGANRIIFISSTGVYGRNDGSWVDEDSPCRPTHDSGQALLAAEQVLHDHPLGPRGIVLRLAGIYGPGRLPRRADLRRRSRAPYSRRKRGKPDPRQRRRNGRSGRRKPRPLPRTYLVADGHPVSRREYLSSLAELLGLPPLQFADPGEASSTRNDAIPTGDKNRRGGDKRVSNRRMLAELGVELAYPTYRQGLPKSL